MCGAVTIALTIAVVLKSLDFTKEQRTLKEFVDLYLLQKEVMECSARIIQICVKIQIILL